MIDLWGWLLSTPPITRVFFLGSFSMSVLTALDFLSPLHLYYNYKLIFEHGEVWRLITNFLFFGSLRLEFILHMYFLIHYCGQLERDSFFNRTPSFLLFMMMGIGIILCVAPFLNVMFFGSALTTMIVYLWSRRNRDAQLLLFGGMLTFRAPYLPWVFVGMSIVMGHSFTVDLVGIAAGHIYYYLADVYPAIAAARGWERKEVLTTPSFLYYICGMTPPQEQPRQQERADDVPIPVDDAPLFRAAPPPPQPPQPQPEPPHEPDVLPPPREPHAPQVPEPPVRQPSPRPEAWGVLPEDLVSSDEEDTTETVT